MYICILLALHPNSLIQIYIIFRRHWIWLNRNCFSGDNHFNITGHNPSKSKRKDTSVHLRCTKPVKSNVRLWNFTFDLAHFDRHSTYLVSVSAFAKNNWTEQKKKKQQTNFFSAYHHLNTIMCKFSIYCVKRTGSKRIKNKQQMCPFVFSSISRST